MGHRFTSLAMVVAIVALAWPPAEPAQAAGMPSDIQVVVDDIVARYEAAGLVVPPTPIRYSRESTRPIPRSASSRGHATSCSGRSRRPVDRGSAAVA